MSENQKTDPWKTGMNPSQSYASRRVTSERASPEPAGPVPVVAAVATGSNPASFGVLDMLEWKWRSIAAQHRKSAEQTQSSHESTRFKSAAEALEACALELRLLTGATTERQPESNAKAQPRSGESPGASSAEKL